MTVLVMQRLSRCATGVVAVIFTFAVIDYRASTIAGTAVQHILELCAQLYHSLDTTEPVFVHRPRFGLGREALIDRCRCSKVALVADKTDASGGSPRRTRRSAP